LPNQIADAPDGAEYQLVVVVYDPSQDGAPRRMTLQGADRHVLGIVKVMP
jgi:hypothetical protein